MYKEMYKLYKEMYKLYIRK